jgi:galactitol-specific phosphotransferase system IIB component
MKHTLRKLLLLCALGLGSLVGVPMRAEEIEELMQQMNVPKVARTVQDESEKPEWLKDLIKLLD